MKNQYNINEPLILNGFNENDIIKDKQALNTLNHILNHRENVKERLLFLADELYKRAYHHDDSKLQYPELEWLIEMDKEPRYEYGTPEYFDKMQRWDKFFQHHYAHNRHHPGHFSDCPENLVRGTGVNGMNLVDLCEYVIDIISYQKELHLSTANDTVDKQQERFKLDDQLSSILKNTLSDYFAWFGDQEPLIESDGELNDQKHTEALPPIMNLEVSQLEKILKKD